VSDLTEVERDAQLAAQALARLSAYVRCRGDERDSAALNLADEGAVAAERVLAYLREVRGKGDGVAAAYPPRLGPWRDWVPPRGHLLDRQNVRRAHGDPGE
jgi:hypothetical protein